VESEREASVRVDRWLCAARVYRSRSLANRACAGGKVRINERPAKAHHALKVGDEVRVSDERGVRILGVAGLAEKRLAAPLARELYEDRSPPPPPREERAGARERGAGRPTKRDRRLLSRLRGKS
jgi:ribosome-associated heat shock protein Hsp15